MLDADTGLVTERCAAQLLSGTPAATPVDVVRTLLAVQGQDPRGARLAIRARTGGLTAADVDRALTDDRSLLITWLNRGTLHLVTAEDYWWLQPLTTPPLETAIARRLEQEGVSPGEADRAVELIDAALAADGALTRAQLGDVIKAGRHQDGGPGAGAHPGEGVHPRADRQGPGHRPPACVRQGS